MSRCAILLHVEAFAFELQDGLGEEIGRERQQVSHVRRIHVRPIYSTDPSHHTSAARVRRALLPSDWATLDAMQPYHDETPERVLTNTLSVIQRFDNTAKHEVIHPSFLVPARVGRRNDPRFEEVVDAPLDAACGFERTTELYRYRLKPGADATEPIKTKVAIDLDFGLPGDCMNILALQLLGKSIAERIHRFRA